MSPDGKTFVSITETTATAVDTDSWETLWEYEIGATTDQVFSVAYSPSGDLVALSIHDPESFVVGLPPDPDGLPARVVLLDSRGGTVVGTIEFPDCPAPILTPDGFSPDGTLLAVAVSNDGACEPGVDLWSLQLIDTDSFETVVALDVPNAASVSWSADGSLLAASEFVFLDRGRAIIYETEGFEVGADIEDVLIGALSPDGSKLAAVNGDREFVLIDVESGVVIDRLAGLGDAPWSWDWSEDGRAIGQNEISG